MSTQFGDKYRKWARLTKATMRIQHKPGDVMEVDWAGNTLPVWDSVTGESSPAYLFVAVLPCSGYAYVEVCSDMKLENWLMCHVHAYTYFGGVTRLLIPDKTYLRQLMKDYLKKNPNAMPEEKADLREWVMSGHSPYDNPDGLCDDFCHPLDFISAMRFWIDFCPESSEKADQDKESF